MRQREESARNHSTSVHYRFDISILPPTRLRPIGSPAAKAARLSKHGEDVYVEGVEAYSTLGWFKDLLLNTFLYNSEPILAEVLFHELGHQKVFASGDTDFNEAFATVVAKAGVRRWLRDQGDMKSLARNEAALERNSAFV